MAIAQVSIAAATAILGYDILRDSVFKRAGVDRVLRGAALRGSAAAGDSKVSIYVDTVKVAEFYNTNTGFPNRDDFFPVGDVFVPAGADISAIVDDAPATNPLNLLLDLEELVAA